MIIGLHVQILLRSGCLVTANTKYKLSWNLRDEKDNPVPLVGGGSIVKEIPCSAKDTFMLLSQDQGICYPDSLYIRNDNYAYAYDNNGEQLGSGHVYFYRSGEMFLDESLCRIGQVCQLSRSVVACASRECNHYANCERCGDS